ncbi:MAG: HypC/HybG/HupF family hydrogenase formation chaperone [Planctomycetota bacterium]|nr:HypC/HybG/HupF family hydrogenase formation chaperone [Planctomycetota bacterium]
MCLAIPARLHEAMDPMTRLAVVDVMGVRRRVNMDLLRQERVEVGDWVLVHVGFAMSKISAEHAAEQIRVLEALGEVEGAREEAAGYQFDGSPSSRVESAANGNQATSARSATSVNSIEARMEPRA